MGYKVDITGTIDLNHPLTEVYHTYLTGFARTRRMRRDMMVAACIADPIRIQAELPIGPEGCFFIGTVPENGPWDHNYKNRSIIDRNEAPNGQPGLWCPWVPNERGTALMWTGYEYVEEFREWLEYLLDTFIVPWGYIANGTIEWRRESHRINGIVRVTDNTMCVYERQENEYHPF